MLAALLNIPTNHNEWAIWSFHHRLSHAAIRQAIQAQKNTTLVDYQLDPIPEQAFQDWLERNQQTHIEMDAAIGAQSVDLTDVDPSKKNQLAAWIYLHYQEHFTAEQVLNIGT